MFTEGDIFKIDEKEYRVRIINKNNTCWLEPVLYRDSGNCMTGGMNKIVHIDELSKLEYMNVCY